MLKVEGIEDERFMENVNEAREDGYHSICVACGVGLEEDGYDTKHEDDCPDK